MQREVWLEEGLESLDFDHEQGSSMAGHWENHLVTVRGRGLGRGCVCWGGRGRSMWALELPRTGEGQCTVPTLEGTRSSRLLLFAQMMHV